MMRKIALFVLVIFSTCSNIQAQHTNLWGVTGGGGSDNAGTIFRYSYTNNTYDTVYSFNHYFSHGPAAALNYCSITGLFYGAATTGGLTNISNGAIYSFSPLNYSYNLLVDFNPASKGNNPQGRLFETSPCHYWGTTYLGGTGAYGTVYSYDAIGNVHTVRKNLTSNTTGYDAYDGPILAPNGKIYGITHGGVSGSNGVIYEIDTLSNTYTIKQQFVYATGNQSQGRLVLATNGKMYGATSIGGTANGGTLFEYDYISNTLTTLINFTSATTGSTCTGHLIQATDGNIYGVTSNGGDSAAGTIFRYSIATSTFTKLASLYPYTIGKQALGGLCEAPDGKLYGLTYQGGAYGKGTLYAYNISTATLSKKVDFSGPNGANPSFTDLTVATTNTQPQILVNNLSDSTCAGTQDTLLFSVADADNDTLQGTLSSSNAALISTAGSSFSRIGNTNIYRLIYSAAAGVTGPVSLSIAFSDGHGATGTLNAAVYVKSCVVVPPPTAIAGIGGVQAGIVISPNPATGSLSLQTADPADDIRRLRLTNTLGQSISVEGSHTGRQVLDVSSLARGVYFMQVVTGKEVYGATVVLR